MPRPPRIQYENALYHVMNRGRARNNIFLNEDHYKIFLEVLKESVERFGCIIHAYCLMPNHYHLLIQTPIPNLTRVMRHINAVYTQRYNRSQKTDGPLFRGRYKAILIESNQYLLHLTKYIHRNPIEVKTKNNQLTKNLKDYKWSSYPSYLNLTPTPKWLTKSTTLSLLKNDKDIIKRYQLYVDEENNPEIQSFFNKKNQNAILGNKEFKEDLLNKLLQNKTQQDQVKKEIRREITTQQIIESIATTFNITTKSITQKATNKKAGNFPRKLAMYLCQKYKDHSLPKIAETFNLKNPQSISYYLGNVKKELQGSKYKKEINSINQLLNV